MKTIDDINLETWFTDRELKICPRHFVPTKTPISKESKQWILEKLHGRFSLSEGPNNDFFTIDMCPWFEDPKEAVFYELKWG
jgi:hypothetical protein